MHREALILGFDDDAEGGWLRVDTIREHGPVAVIGDIHGRADLLAQLLHKLGPLPLFVVGDIIDRGPDSRGVIEQLVARQARGVRGNHEVWLCQMLEGGGVASYAEQPGYGGGATLTSYGITASGWRERQRQALTFPAAHRQWLLGLPAVVRLELDGAPWWIVHAGVSSIHRLGRDAVQRLPKALKAYFQSFLSERLEPSDMDTLDGPIIYGHMAREEPIDAGHAIGINTRCGFLGGALTAVVLPERRFVTVKDDAWVEPPSPGPIQSAAASAVRRRRPRGPVEER